MSEAFFQAISELVDTVKPEFEYRLFYDADGAIISIERAIVSEIDERDYITISQNQYDAVHAKTHDYRVIDSKLILYVPDRRYWDLKQEDLTRNPYICSPQ